MGNKTNAFVALLSTSAAGKGTQTIVVFCSNLSFPSTLSFFCSTKLLGPPDELMHIASVYGQKENTLLFLYNPLLPNVKLHNVHERLTKDIRENDMLYLYAKCIKNQRTSDYFTVIF